jgi:hypothetical protein
VKSKRFEAALPKRIKTALPNRVEAVFRAPSVFFKITVTMKLARMDILVLIMIPNFVPMLGRYGTGRVFDIMQVKKN